MQGRVREGCFILIEGGGGVCFLYVACQRVKRGEIKAGKK